MVKLLHDKRFFILLEIIFFLSVFYLSIVPLRDFDIWFHVKAGEVISNMGIIHHDVFSYNTAGREWFTYGWLFQVIVYKVEEFLGFDSIKYFTAFFATIQIGLIYLILRKVLDIKRIAALLLTFFFFASIFEFITARPQIVAYTLLLINLFFVLLYFIKGKNLLYLTIPITLLWANMHGSIFLGIAFFAGYATISITNYYLNKKDKFWIQRAKTLAIYAVITAFLSILPPIGFTQYRLLIMFFEHGDMLTRFINEWTPLYVNPISFYVFTATVVVVFVSFFIHYKNGDLKKNLWIIPLVPLVLISYIANRNLFLSYIALTLILASAWQSLDFSNLKKSTKILILSVITVFIGFNIWVLDQKKLTFRLYYPVNAVKFMKQHRLAGNMFNEYGYGGYLLYQLYPDYKVFYDGGTDLYICCEMPDTLEMSTKKDLPDDDYSKFLYSKIWDKYKISYVILRTEKHVILRKVANILAKDPNWNLIYWDDDTQIIVRRDGKNTKIINSFGTQAATPYERNPFKKDAEDQALKEYQRMLSITDSAKTRNAIGYIYLAKSEFEKARPMFEAAIQQDPTNESAYMNLAELEAKDGNHNEAISLYEHAKQLAPDRGLIYIRLGQLYVQRDGDINIAREIWTTGFQNTIDSDARKKLQNLLDSY